MSSRSNGYEKSILQTEECCFLCGRRDRKLDRHEVFGGAYRDKSKHDGLWLLLCHEGCHLGPNGAHGSKRVRDFLRSYAQSVAMEKYNWSTEDFIQEYGKNYL